MFDLFDLFDVFNISKGGGANIVPMTDDFLGYKRVDITSISPRIQVIDTNDDAPKTLMLSASPTTALGTRTLTSDPIIPYQDLEFSWHVTHANGDEIEDLEGLIDPRDGSAVNPYVDQVSPEFTCVIREAGDYKVTMTARGQNGLSDAVVSTTEYLFTVTESTAAHYWYANAGNDLNDGLDPHGFALSTATYTNATRELTQIGAFTSYVHDVSMNFTNRDNYIYISGATEAITAGLYKIASKLNDDTIVLADALGADYTNVTSSDGPKLTLAGGIVGGHRHVKGGETHTVTSYIETAHNLDNSLIGYGSGKATIRNSHPSEIYVVYTGNNSSRAGGESSVLISNLILDAQDVYLRYPLGGSITSSNSCAQTYLYDRCNYINGRSANAVRPTSNATWYTKGLIYGGEVISLKYTGAPNYTISSANLGANTVVVNTSIAAGTFPSGVIEFADDGLFYEYDSWSGSTFTLKSGTTLAETHTGNLTWREKRAMGIYTSSNNASAVFRVVGLTMDVESDDKTFDHFIYPSGKQFNNSHYAYINFRSGDTGYAINLNTSEDGVNSRYTCINNNNVSSGAKFGFDASNANNNSEDAGFTELLILRNKANTTAHFILSYNGYGVSYLHNEYYGDGIFIAEDNKTGSVYSPEDFYSVIAGNKVYTSKNAVIANLGSATEISDNEIWVTGTDDPVVYNSSLLAGRSFEVTGNTFYAPANSSIVGDDNGTLQDVAALDTALGGTNTYEMPNWSDPANGNFSPAVAPSLSGTFDMADATAGDEYNYDVSALATGGDPVVSWQLTGTPPTNAVISSLGVITGTAVTETLAANSFGVTATNSGGTSNELLDASGITVVPAAVLKLHLNAGGYGTITGAPMSSILPGGYVQETFSIDDNTRAIITFMAGPSNDIRWTASTGVLQIRFNAGAQYAYFDIPNFVADYGDGSEYIIKVAPVTGNVWQVEIGGTVYNESSSLVVLSTDRVKVNTISSSSWGLVGVIRDFIMDNGTDHYEFAIDSGSITTEAASVGSGTLTFTNIVADDWV